jgi:hypothetical protein
VPAPAERGWGKLILGLIAFVLIPTVPQFRALVPIDQTILLFVPALAACALVGWWAGGRIWLALVLVGLAILIAVQSRSPAGSFHNLERGWSLVLAGSFGLVCLFGSRRPFFPRALLALTVSIGLALMMSALGPVRGQDMNQAVRDELSRRNTESMGMVNAFIAQNTREWNELVAKVPAMGQMPVEMDKQLRLIASLGEGAYPSLLALESLLALAIAWSVYHRLSRTRLGPPLGRLREFRFNDQLVWGLIVGLTIMFLPTMAPLRMLGRNLLVFFGALYALRGLGVLSWFMAPGALAISAAVGFAMLWLPVLQFIAAFGFMLLAVTAFGLGLGDTWADWRSRARSTP